MKKYFPADQMDLLYRVARCADHKQAIEMLSEVDTHPDDRLYDPEEINAYYNARCACYSPDDLGARGKQAEIRQRVAKALQTGRGMAIKDFRAHRQGVADIRGKNSYELKTGKYGGDWYACAATGKEQALTIYSKRKGKSRIAWITEDFTIICTVAWLLEKLEEYPKGAVSFFRYQGGKLVAQPWHTSKKKTAFLQAIAEESQDLPEYEDYGNMVGWDF